MSRTFVGAVVVVGCAVGGGTAQAAVTSGDGTAQASAVVVPAGFTVKKVVGDLTFPTAVTWDDQGRMFVAEAGGQFLEEPAPSRILRIEAGGRAVEHVRLGNKGVGDSVAGMSWFRGAFYLTGRDARNRTGAVYRVRGQKVRRIITGIIDSQSEHQVNDIRPGPDGRLYVASGPAANSAVVGLDLAPFVARSPRLKTTPCRDLVLTGLNYETPDFRTRFPHDVTLTGAFVPFGTATTPGQRIQGRRKCGGAILAFDPARPEASVRPYADGFRNVIGMAWTPGGAMYAAVNSYDVRGSRPVNDDTESTYRVRRGAWYGEPDFSAALRPVTLPRYDSPDSLQAPVFVGRRKLFGPRKLGFVIDHRASGLRPPDPKNVVGVHEIGSSPSQLDVAPRSWGPLAGGLFVAEWGDLAPETSPLRNNKPGYRVVLVTPSSGGKAIPFVRNVRKGPASGQGAAGRGIERPYSVRFGPDGAMYIVDYGTARVNQARTAEGQVPYEFVPGSGAVWRVSHTGQLG